VWPLLVLELACASPLFLPRERRRAIAFDRLAGKGPLDERRRIRKRAARRRGMVEVGIVAPFYPRSSRKRPWPAVPDLEVRQA
jgi:hypothetical protein